MGVRDEEYRQPETTQGASPGGLFRLQSPARGRARGRQIDNWRAFTRLFMGSKMPGCVNFARPQPDLHGLECRVIARHIRQNASSDTGMSTPGMLQRLPDDFSTTSAETN
jgi:hypothetical protein